MRHCLTLYPSRRKDFLDFTGAQQIKMWGMKSLGTISWCLESHCENLTGSFFVQTDGHFSLSTVDLVTRRTIADLIYLYKILNNRETYEYYENYVQNLNFNAKTVRTRDQSLFYIPFNRLSVSKNSPIARTLYLSISITF
jgi:hypothetical protein